MTLGILTSVELHALGVFKLIMAMRSVVSSEPSPHGATVSLQLSCMILLQAASCFHSSRPLHRLRLETLTLALRERRMGVTKLDYGLGQGRIILLTFCLYIELMCAWNLHC